MRNIVLFILLWIVAACTSTNENAITVHITVKNQTYSKVALVYNTTITEMDLDKNGKAECVIEGEDAVYAKLFYGETPKQVFLQKGDEVNISFDAATFKDQIKVEGKNAAVTEYLNSTTFTPLSPEDYVLPFDKYMEKVEKKILDATKLLQARNLESINPLFVQMEEGRIHYLYSLSVLVYPMGHGMFTKNESYSGDDNYYNWLSSETKEREDLINVDEYREFIREASFILASKEETITGNILDKTVIRIQYIADHFTNPQVKEKLIHALAIEYVRQFGIKGITEMENLYNTYVTNPYLKASYKAVCDEWNITTPGHISPNFQAEDIDGKLFSLNSFKGKYLYIDLWATWCGPCKQEIPYLKELEKKFEGKNITFISLSIDRDKAEWEKMVKTGNLSALQLYLGEGSKFQKDYDIEGIPHFILLDPEGKIVNASMIRPSSPDIEKVLNALPRI